MKATILGTLCRSESGVSNTRPAGHMWPAGCIWPARCACTTREQLKNDKIINFVFIKLYWVLFYYFVAHFQLVPN